MLSQARDRARRRQPASARSSSARARRAAPPSAGDEPVVDARFTRVDRRRRCPCPSASRTRRACARAGPWLRGSPRARAPRAGCARRRGSPPAAPAAPGSGRESPPAAGPARTSFTATGRRSRRALERGDRRRRVAELARPAQRRVRQGAALAARPPVPPLPCPARVTPKSAPIAQQLRADLRAHASARLAGGSGSAQIAGRPARKMPAFSNPIASRSRPG